MYPRSEEHFSYSLSKLIFCAEQVAEAFMRLRQPRSILNPLCFSLVLQDGNAYIHAYHMYDIPAVRALLSFSPLPAGAHNTMRLLESAWLVPLPWRRHLTAVAVNSRSNDASFFQGPAPLPLLLQPRQLASASRSV